MRLHLRTPALAAALLWGQAPAAALPWSWAQSTAEAADSRGPVLLQTAASLGVMAGESLGERRMLKFFDGQMIINSSEVLLQSGAIAPKSGCTDSLTWADPYWRSSCGGWAGHKCSGYSFSAELQQSCPIACGLCTASSPAEPVPPLAQFAPKPRIVPAKPSEKAGFGQCISATASGGCVLRSSGCQGQVTFGFKCTSSGGLDFLFELSMPDDYNWSLHDHCARCFDIQVIQGR